MSIWNRKKRTIVDSPIQVEESPIQTELLAKMEAMLQSWDDVLANPVVCHVAPPTPSEEVKRLLSMGFRSAQPVQEWDKQLDSYKNELHATIAGEEYVKNIAKTIKVYFDAKDRFGEQTLLVRYDDFQEICEKFNLVSGTFDDYTGSVPVENICDIERAMRQIETVSYINKLYRIFAATNGSEVEPFFPFSLKKGVRPNIMAWTMKALFTEQDAVRLFITAPSNLMKTKTAVVTMIVNEKDPFICAHTNYGILIFSRWGEEANCSIIRRYEEFDEKVNVIAERLINRPQLKFVL